MHRKRRMAVVGTLATLLLAQPAAADIGDWTSTYDFGAGDGAAGWMVFQDPLPPPFYPGPYYTVHLKGGPHGPGLGAEPIGGMLYPHADNSEPGGGPHAIFSVRAPGTTRLKSATFSDIDALNDSERQVIRVALYPDPGQGSGVSEDFYDPGVVVNDATSSLTAPPGEQTRYAQLWLFSVCRESVPGSEVYDDCPTLPLAPGSYAHLGKVVMHLRDSDAPTVTASGPLTQVKGWTNSRDPRTVALLGSDPGSGVEELTLRVKSPGQKLRTVMTSQAPCDAKHNVSGPVGREAQVCPAEHQISGQDGLAKLPDGQSVYTATATDLSGRNHEHTFSVRIDRTPPKGLAATGLPKRWINGRKPVVITARASDSRARVASLAATIAGRPAGTVKLAGVASARAAIGLEMGQVADGVRAVRLTATDRAGNTTAPKTIGRLRLDRTAPTVAAPRGTRRGKTVSVRTHASDANSGVARYQARTRIGTKAFGGWRTIDGGRLTLTTKAAVVVQVRATDRAGNASEPREATIGAKQRGAAAPREKHARSRARRRAARRRARARRLLRNSSRACQRRDLGRCKVDPWVRAVEVSQGIAGKTLAPGGAQTEPPTRAVTRSFEQTYRSPFYTFASTAIDRFPYNPNEITERPPRLVAHRPLLVRAYLTSRAAAISRARRRAGTGDLPVTATIELLNAAGSVVYQGSAVRPTAAGIRHSRIVRPGRPIDDERSGLSQTLNAVVPALQLAPGQYSVRVRLKPAAGWRECPGCGGARDSFTLTNLTFEGVYPSVRGGAGSERLPIDVHFVRWQGAAAVAPADRPAVLARIERDLERAWPVAEGAVHVTDRTAGTSLAIAAPKRDASGVWDCLAVYNAVATALQADDASVPSWSTGSPRHRGEAPAAPMPRYLGIVSDAVSMSCGGRGQVPGRLATGFAVSGSHEFGHNLGLHHAGDLHGQSGPGVGEPIGTYPAEPFPDVPGYPPGAGRLNGWAYASSPTRGPIASNTAVSDIKPVAPNEGLCRRPTGAEDREVLQPDGNLRTCQYDVMSYGPVRDFLSPNNWNLAVDQLNAIKTCELSTPNCLTGSPTG